MKSVLRALTVLFFISASASKVSSVTLLVATLLLTGCEAQVAGTEEPAGIAPAAATLQVHYPEAMAAIRDGGFGEEVHVRMEAHSAFSSQVLSILHGAPSWQEAHRAMLLLLDRELEAQGQGTTRGLREQIVAGYMLQVESLRRSRTPDALDATEAYVQMLIEHGSPEAHLTVEGLKKLDGHIAAEEHRRLTETALGNARDRLSEKLSCERCGLEQLRERHPELFTGASAYPEARLASAIIDLEAMLSDS